MGLEEAIRIITEDTQHPTAHFMPELLEAQKLGIEALKRIRDARDIEPGSPAGDLLPGETE